MAQYERVLALAPGTRAAHEANLGMASLYYAEGEYKKTRELFVEVLRETKDWDLVKYSTYRLKELDRYKLKTTQEQLVASIGQSKTVTNCGVLALAKIFELTKQNVSIQETAELVNSEAAIVSLANLKNAAAKKGLKVIAAKLSFRQLQTIEKPLIAHLKASHFVVVTDSGKKEIEVIDPHSGQVDYTKEAFQKKWTGYVLLFPQEEKLPDSIALLLDKVLQRVKGGHHLHGDNLGGPESNGPSTYDSGPS
jgi:predicted double-glycine peptidase